MTIRALISAASVSLLASCTPALRDSVVEDAQLHAVAAADGTRKLEALEPLALRVSKGRASRDTGALALRLAGGRILRLENGRGDCTFTAADCLNYIFGADLPSRHAFLVFAARYEGGEWYLIDDRTTKRTQLDAPPLFSPDGARFLVVADDEAYSSFFGLEIYRMQSDSAAVEWRHSLASNAPEFMGREPPFCPGLTIPVDVSWQDNFHVALHLKSLGFDDCHEHFWPASIELQPDGWRLITDWPRGG